MKISISEDVSLSKKIDSCIGCVCYCATAHELWSEAWSLWFFFVKNLTNWTLIIFFLLTGLPPLWFGPTVMCVYLGSGKRQSTLTDRCLVPNTMLCEFLVRVEAAYAMSRVYLSCTKPYVYIVCSGQMSEGSLLTSLSFTFEWGFHSLVASNSWSSCLCLWSKDMHHYPSFLTPDMWKELDLPQDPYERSDIFLNLDIHKSANFSFKSSPGIFALNISDF